MFKNDKNIGLYCAIAGLIFYLLLIIFVVLKLPNMLGTFIVFSWVCLPGIAAGIIFHIMDKRGKWDDEEKENLP